MKKLIYLLGVTSTMCLAAACNNGVRNDKSDAADSNSVAVDSGVGANADSAAIIAGDTTFATKAAISGMAEVEFGKLALEKADHAKVKDFASMMVRDHDKANEELKSIAGAKQIMLPATLDLEHSNKLDQLKTKSGADFDKAYVEAMVEGHEKTLSLMEEGSTKLNDSALKAFAEKNAPIVRHHLDLIKQIRSEVK